MKNILLLMVALPACLLVYSNASLPAIFGNNMVLQRNVAIPIWGWAVAGEKITVSFNKQLISGIADRQGHWMIKLNKEAAGGPYQLIIKAHNTISFSDVLVGEVWICAGQSNMEFEVRSAINANTEIAQAAYPQIRHFKIPEIIPAASKFDQPAGHWEVCSPENVGVFTAVGYFFAKEIFNRLKVPVGLINASWGGTEIETWTSQEALAKSSEFKDMMRGLPRFNPDSLEKAAKDTAIKDIKTLQGSFPDTGNISSWKDAAIADSTWPEMKLPSLWEGEKLGDLDGVVWFRKTINIPVNDAGKAATLQLSMIDDNDTTYVNGVMIASTNGYNKKRSYSIPAGVLKEGLNLIAVRVEDTGGGGGIYGDAANLKLTIVGDVISLAGDWHFRAASLSSTATYTDPDTYPSTLFNAMILPLVPYGIEGVLWYQGESNADRAHQYRKALPLLITDWRRRWQQGDFPFYFVQLASFNAANGNSLNGSAWAELREAQTMSLSLVNTGMSITTDIGETKDIHPKNKQVVGKRLAAIALHNAYGRKEVVYTGPVYQSMKIEEHRIVLSFKNVGSGLSVKDPGGNLKGFEIAGADKQFYTAVASIEGNTVVVYNKNVSNPVAARFGWADDAGMDNLLNTEGFPAGPFRTDQWKGLTDDEKYAITH